MIKLDDVHALKTQLHSTCRIKINNDADALIALIDELAERATCIQGQGLSHFMQTRKEFIAKVEALRGEYTTLLCPDESSPFAIS